MKSSKKYKAFFWATFAINCMVAIVYATIKNYHAMLGWLIVLVWMLRFYKAAIVLDKAVKVMLKLGKCCGIEINEETAI